MASANGSTECSGSAVPQWKRDLIQRRRQQNKVFSGNGAGVKLCSAVAGTFPTNNGTLIVDSSASDEPVERLLHDNSCIGNEDHRLGELTSLKAATSDGNCFDYSSFNNCHKLSESSVSSSRRTSRGGATRYRESSRDSDDDSPNDGSTIANVCGGDDDGQDGNEINGINGTNAAADVSIVSTVACKMRLDTDLSSFRSNSPPENAGNFDSTRKNDGAIGVVDVDSYGNNTGIDDKMINYGNNGAVKKKGSTKKNRVEECEESRVASRIIGRTDDKTSVSLYASEETRNDRAGNGKRTGDDGESDSSEELQYGPGIVNRLKSKYLNLTLREMNKSRGSVQRFRRAASLEDLLDCDDERSETSTTRKYAKRYTPGQAIKTDRYGNATRGNESIKRARSVETLVGYDSPAASDDTNRLVNRSRRIEPVNDHIVLIDRSSVKIESRLTDPADRPKPVNRPKRIKPLLAETERPPPDLVRTTMRLFEGSVKKFKPKGQVAIKVATFKTINDTYKAQAMKKVKPPVQPKPFANGNSKGVPSSPKKVPTAKSFGETTFDNTDSDEHGRNCVVAEPTVQSVSSVVSKFQRIEKSYTPSASPEPIGNKLKFSPSPSPEPSLTHGKLVGRSNDTVVKSPPVTPVPSPRISSPAGGLESSTKRDSVGRSTTPSGQSFARASIPEVTNDSQNSVVIHEDERRTRETGVERMEIRKNDEHKCLFDDEKVSAATIITDVSNVDCSRTISKLALENISKAGITMRYNFEEKSPIGKSYLPGVATRNSQKWTKTTAEMLETLETSVTSANQCEEETTKIRVRISSPETTIRSPIFVDSTNDNEPTTRLYENNKESCESVVASTTQPEYRKTMAAVSSLPILVKASSPTSTTTPSSHTTSNDNGKKITSQKSDVSPPQKQIGIIRPLVSTKTQIAQQNLSNRELEKNLINRVKSIEQPTKVVVSLRTAEEIQPAVKKTVASPVVVAGGGGGGGGGGGLWDTKPWNQANNTMVFNFSNRKDVPDYIENDGLIVRRKREKQKMRTTSTRVGADFGAPCCNKAKNYMKIFKVGDGDVIVLDATIDASTTDESDWEISGGPPSPCDVSFANDNVLINGRSNLSKQPRNHKHRIQFDDGATRTFEYPSEASMLEDEGTSVDGDSSLTSQQSSQGANKSNSTGSSVAMSSALLGGGGLASFTPSKVELASEGFELGVTRTTVHASAPIFTSEQSESKENEKYLKSDEDAAAWGVEATADLLY